MGSRHGTRTLGHRTAVGECTLGNRHHCVPNGLIDVLHASDGVVGVSAVVVIVVDGGVVDHRIGIVYPSEIAGAYSVGRDIGLTRSQGEPPYGCGIPRGEAHAEAGPASANPPHQRRRITWRHIHRSGYPAPIASDGSPAAIVGGRVSPRCVVHPGPTPGRDPSPLPVVIRRPISSNVGGPPDLAVTGLIRPLAVLVEILIAAHFAGHVTGRRGSVFAEVT